MAFVLTRNEFLINEVIVLKDEKGNEIANFEVTLNDEEFNFFRDMLEKAQSNEEVTDKEELQIKEIVFKNLETDITDYEKTKVSDYIVGRVVNKLGLDRMNTLNYATSTLQKKLKK